MVIPGQLVLARETDRKKLHRAVAAGRVERIRSGAYLGRRESSEDDTFEAARQRARDLVLAVHRQLRADHVFGHTTAALLWGCTLWTTPAHTHLWQRYRPSSRSAGDLRRHVGDVPSSQRSKVDGLPVTTLARTVVDCALTLHPMEALVVADSALRLSPALDPVAAADVLARVARRNGRRRAAWVLEHADAGADSAWESWLRYVCLRAGLPRPVTQAPVRTRRGLYHCDLGWPEHGVYAEFDGRVKYVDGALGPGHDGATELLREKDRAEALLDAGVVPVRVRAADARPRPGEPGVLQRIADRFPAEVLRSCRVDPLLPPPLT
ncbi:hypothetical protein [Isoptericola haloaureus]|uniref:Transcriptional regulator, AbiEi antitoxin, Type IV TA system n=1 Tax=Isoptericola haloaureus TaxID=1542902 RepID=A0ABU7Z8C4_9MICO